MATSSAIKLGDLGLVWSNVAGSADLVLVDGDLASDLGLVTAALLSLFLDRRAANDDVPPSGDPNDRRGWWADEFLSVAGDKYGSRLWLLARSKLTNETVLRAKEYVLEALAWMIEDKVVASITPTAEITTAPQVLGDEVIPAGSLLVGADLYRPGRDPASFRFSHVWNQPQGSA